VVMAMVLAGLMVSTVPYRSLASLKLSRAMLIGSALGMGAVMVVARRYNLSTAFTIILGSYIVYCPLEALFQDRRRRHGSMLTIDPDDFDSDPFDDLL